MLPSLVKIHDILLSNIGGMRSADVPADFYEFLQANHLHEDSPDDKIVDALDKMFTNTVDVCLMLALSNILGVTEESVEDKLSKYNRTNGELVLYDTSGQEIRTERDLDRLRYDDIFTLSEVDDQCANVAAILMCYMSTMHIVRMYIVAFMDTGRASVNDRCGVQLIKQCESSGDNIVELMLNPANAYWGIQDVQNFLPEEEVDGKKVKRLDVVKPDPLHYTKMAMFLSAVTSRVSSVPSLEGIRILERIAAYQPNNNLLTKAVNKLCNNTQ